MPNDVQVKRTLIHNAITLSTSYTDSVAEPHHGMNQCALEINYTQGDGTGFVIQAESVDPSGNEYILLFGADSGSGVIEVNARSYSATVGTGKYLLPISFLGEQIIIGIKSIAGTTDTATVNLLQAKV
jgi:hypothetical protein